MSLLLSHYPIKVDQQQEEGVTRFIEEAVRLKYNPITVREGHLLVVV